jgi:hypothetical protein
MRARLGAAAPERVLVVSEDAGIRALIAMELRGRVPCAIDVCALEQLAAEGTRLVGALVVTTPASLPRVERLVPADQPCVTVSYTSVDDHVGRVRALTRPSVIGVASISAYFLQLARGLLAPAIGRRHTLREHLIRRGGASRVGAVDVLFCDAITYRWLRLECPGVTVVRHDMIADATFSEIAATLKA